METEQLIGVDVQKASDGKSGTITIFGKHRNYFKFFGSNLATPAVPDSRNQLTTFSLEAPSYLRQGVIALSYYEINDRGDIRSNPKGFLHISHNGLGEVNCELKKTFVPPIGRMAHVEDDGIVAMVGKQLVASFKKPGALLADADKLCAWVVEQISNEQLLESIAEHEQESKDKKTIEQLELIIQGLEIADKAKGEKLNKFFTDLLSAEEKIKRLQEEKEKISKDAQKIQISLTAIFRRFNEYQKLDFLSKLFTTDTIEKIVKEELEICPLP